MPTEMLDQATTAISRTLLHYLNDLASAGVQQLPARSISPAETRNVSSHTPHASATKSSTAKTPARSSSAAAPPSESAPSPTSGTLPSATGGVSGEPARHSLVSPPSMDPPQAAAMAASPASRQQRENQLHVLSQEVSQCFRCQELSALRTQTVFGVGNPEARLCFLGEGPGADEDTQGEPFVGRAGQLLNRILAACTLRREDVYILNVVKCRPPGNRNPTPEEVVHCRPFFARQLEIIRPEFICCLGSVAASALLETNTTIGRLRGRLHTWRFAKVLATYHPAYLLRNPPAKAEVWKDMQLLMKEMGIVLPTSSE